MSGSLGFSVVGQMVANPDVCSPHEPAAGSNGIEAIQVLIQGRLTAVVYIVQQYRWAGGQAVLAHWFTCAGYLGIFMCESVWRAALQTHQIRVIKNVRL